MPATATENPRTEQPSQEHPFDKLVPELTPLAPALQEAFSNLPPALFERIDSGGRMYDVDSFIHVPATLSEAGRGHNPDMRIYAFGAETESPRFAIQFQYATDGGYSSCVLYFQQDGSFDLAESKRGKRGSNPNSTKYATELVKLIAEKSSDFASISQSISSSIETVRANILQGSVPESLRDSFPSQVATMVMLLNRADVSITNTKNVEGERLPSEFLLKGEIGEPGILIGLGFDQFGDRKLTIGPTRRPKGVEITHPANSGEIDRVAAGIRLLADSLY